GGGVGGPGPWCGLAGGGVRVVACTGGVARTGGVGGAWGRGKGWNEATGEIGGVVGWLKSADEVMRQAEHHGIELPISNAVRAVLHGEITPEAALKELLARERKPEYPQALFT
ncbi:glycerol-3-phosphate dehydrogenase, partial [Xanthomonas hortorum pv. gardneri]